ncbi:MAG: polysaccharide deacetylase, partial [Muricoprocola sp.]
MNTERRKVRDRELEQQEAEQALRAQRRRRRRKRQRALSILVLVLVLAFLGTAGFLVLGRDSNLVSEIADLNIADRIFSLISGDDKIGNPAETETETEVVQMTESTTEKQTETETETENHDEEIQQLIMEADALAVTYDYSGAIKLLKASDYYEQNTELQDKVSEYKALKKACVAIKPEEVTHIFYHSLVVDPSKAFDPDKDGYDGWQQWMTTVTEFDKITQSMYDREYVLVGIHDLVKIKKNEDGSVSVKPKNIYLPEGKKAYVLSLDDLNYYHTYDDRGVASKIVLDSDGKPTCEYIEDDGTVVTGAYDVVPRLDAFMEEHPDGC